MAMRKAVPAFGCLLLALSVTGLAAAQEQPQTLEENFYNKSLHYTNRGIEYHYAREQGGVEELTGQPIGAFNCLQAKCHVRTCDTCHKREAGGKASYSVDPALAQAACLNCHEPDKEVPDVHAAKGMKCMDCHSVREIHGDGVAYDTYMQPGALDTRCEKCHASAKASRSHSVHKGKVDCAACHVRNVTTCVNCHLEARLVEKKQVTVQLKNLFFLVNHDGRVKLANLLTYVSRGKTMITIAPNFPHSVSKEGRTCGECHGSAIVRSIAAGTFAPFRWEDGTLKNAPGVVPVVADMKWNLVWLDRVDGKWVPLPDAPAPLVRFHGFCSPLTAEQFRALAKVPPAR